MNLEEKRIGDLLSQRVPFVIPLYQRSYAWERTQVDDFISDIREACRHLRETGVHRTHFFGGIVSVLLDAPGTVHLRKFSVVDGQQRLATFTIAIAQIALTQASLASGAAELKDVDTEALCKSRQARILHDFLQYDDEQAGRPVILRRLRLSKPDDPFFAAMLAAPDRPPKTTRKSHERLLDALQRLRTNLIVTEAGIGTPREKSDNLDRLLRVLTEDCRVAHIMTDNEAEAYQLFQVLNDRGTGLNEGDLLRSKSLELLEGQPEAQATVERAWDEVLAQDYGDIESFLRAYFACRTGKRPGKRTLLDEFMKAALPSPSDPKLADILKGLASDLTKDVMAFRRLGDGEWPYDERDPSLKEWDARRLELLITHLKHTLAMPLLISLARQPQRVFNQAISLMDRFVFRYVNVCHLHVGQLSACYLRHAKRALEDPQPYDLGSFREDLNSLLDRESPTALFRAQLEEGFVYRENSTNRPMSYFLTTLEAYWRWFMEGCKGDAECLDKTVLYDLSSIQIEHIYPKRAKECVDYLESRKHRTGNLTFWSPADNGSSQNAPFTEKREKYEKSAVALNRRLAAFKAWDEASFNSRQAEVVEASTKIFSVETVELD